MLNNKPCKTNEWTTRHRRIHWHSRNWHSRIIV